jgi:hypothetical protein
MRVSFIVLVAAFAMSQTGCPMVDFKELRFTRQKPPESELIGRWTPTKGPHGISWLKVYRLRPSFQIFFRVGDPNAAYAMLFERRLKP